MSVKSCIDVAGWPCPAGSRLRADYVASEDAVLVSRLRAAGAILMGNTNTPEFLMAYETDNALSGKTSNPWEAFAIGGRIERRRSGGDCVGLFDGRSGKRWRRIGARSGAFLRDQRVEADAGADSFNGTFSARGGAFAWLGVVGPMARTIADVRALFDVMKGPDEDEAISAPIQEKIIGEGDLRGLRVGILETDALGKASGETVAAVERAAGLLAENKFIVEPLRVDGLEQAIELWWFFFGPMVAHLYGGMVEGREAELSAMFREYLAAATLKVVPTVDEFMGACVQRDIVRAKILRQMRDVPILLSPVCLGPAFRHGEGNWQAGTGYRDTMRHSQWLNLAGFPGASVPMGFSAEGLPIGVQVIGRPNEDELVLAVAEALEEARGKWEGPTL